MKMLISFLLSIFLFSCAHIKEDYLKPGLLNSERIEKKFGSYGVQILNQDEERGIRFSNLYSIHNGKRITRVLAYVDFAKPIPKELELSHRQILNGGSIGQVLIDNGFKVNKEIVFIGLDNHAPPEVRLEMHTKELNNYPVMIYRLSANDGKQKLFYCSILELYSPDFLTLKDLQEIYNFNIHQKPQLTK